MRYAWSLRNSYFEHKGIKGWLIHRILDRLREWDRQTAQGVTHFIANSDVVRRRIRDYYGRDAVVIHPPVDTTFYCPAPIPREDYYLVLSAFAPYKRLDLAIEACQRLGRRLVVIGSGQDEAKLRSLAGPTTTFLGWQSGEVLRDHLRKCRALLFPGEEDFGIVPVEAQACGTPVLAFGQGGATETVRSLESGNRPTGILFAEQSVECLTETIERFERNAEAFEVRVLREHALRFRAERFDDEIRDFVAEATGLAKRERLAA